MRPYEEFLFVVIAVQQKVNMQNGLKHKTLQLMGATRPASGKYAAII